MREQVTPFLPIARQEEAWRRWLVLFLIFTVVAIFFTLVSYLAIGLLAGENFGLKDSLRWHATRLYLWAALSPIPIKLARRYSILRVRWLSATLFHFVAAMIWSAAHASLYFPLFWFLNAKKNQSIFPPFSFGVQSVGETFMLGVVVYWIVLVATYGVDYYRRYQSEELRASRLQAELAKAQLAALKMQLQPHFIFNTLHSLSDLVLEDAEAATRMIARLGDFLRLTIESSDCQLVPLQQELRFLHCYLEIARVRYQDRLQVQLGVEPETNGAQVPNLILQPLVENAIQHGIAAKIDASRLGIAIRRNNGSLEIVIDDDGPGLNKNGKANGVGLTNTRARLHQLYGSRSSLELADKPAGGTTATLVIPFDLAEPS